jgi:outer membrane phospholipase A
MAVLTPQIIVRMYDEFSYPVRTPSYMPNITLYFLTGSEGSINKLSLFGKIAHHSNGQDGDFYDESGDMNLRYGNFATNYADLGFIKSYYCISV